MGCQIHTSCQRSLTTSSASYTIDQRHSRSATSSPNRGSYTPCLSCRIGIFSAEHLESWKKAFPGPSSNSSAYHTHTLSVCCPRTFATTDAEGGWIQAVSRLVHLNVGKYHKIRNYLIHDFPFTTIPRSISPHSTGPCPSSNLPAWLLTCSKTCRFPISFIHPSFLVWSHDQERGHRWALIQPSPALTGTLDLILLQEVKHIARRLLCT